MEKDEEEGEEESGGMKSTTRSFSKKASPSPTPSALELGSGSKDCLRTELSESIFLAIIFERVRSAAIFFEGLPKRYIQRVFSLLTIFAITTLLSISFWISVYGGSL